MIDTYTQSQNILEAIVCIQTHKWGSLTQATFLKLVLIKAHNFRSRAQPRVIYSCVQI